MEDAPGRVLIKEDAGFSGLKVGSDCGTLTGSSDGELQFRFEEILCLNGLKHPAKMDEYQNCQESVIGVVGCFH